MSAETKQLTRASPFSYTCRGCSRCCHGQVRANPFDVLVLARHLGLSSTEVRRRYLTADSFLARDENDGCVFLGKNGCTVHPARPLVCRLYPLARVISTDGSEHFVRLEPHPLSDGVYGAAGTVDDFLEAQQARIHMEAADRYLRWFTLAVRRLGEAPNSGQSGQQSSEGLLDADAMIASHRPDLDPRTFDPVASMSMHLEAMDVLLLKSSNQTADSHELE